MALTRPAPHAGRPPTTPALPAPADEPAGAAQYAARLQALLGDPLDRHNPYGRSALWAARYDDLPAPPAGLPDADQMRPAAGQLARALRPLFCRDLALAHAWSIRPLLSAPLPHPAAALLGPAALLAAAGGVLRSVTRIVDGLSSHEPGARQWRPVLASVFADLLACESLTTVALRSCPDRDPGAAVPGAGPPRPSGEPLAAVVGYLVPQLVGELLGDLELVLNECGFDGDTLERRTLAKILRDRPFARSDWRSAAAAQVRLVEELSATGGSRPDDGTQLAALFRITGAAAAAPGTISAQTVAATLAGATDRLAGADEPGTAALARVGRRLVTEQRALRVACAATAAHDPADPAARALADRQALLVLAAAALGVREAAAGTQLPFLGTAGWVLLALGRIAGRLGLPLPDRTPDPQPGVWDELARRAANGVDCDLYATRLPW
ncbi:hypothetical protein [Streptomyces sp. TLI_185]|uniref:hypothetical protein n=1 Tax=Streptomyces sp. TLI_185 TaxID=2485151 RepID=UPI000F4D8978|nr:hypothetical protein [Streptomyces sp. TLI_185]RPF24794.1 hypothetical protein EDD92_9738 [Streptomyces sp. TLI_185]